MIGTNKSYSSIQFLTVFLFVIWIIGAILLVFIDLDISIILYDPNSQWANFLADFGELPGFMIIEISLIILFRHYSQNMKDKNQLYAFFIVILQMIILLAIISFIPKIFPSNPNLEIFFYIFILIALFLLFYLIRIIPNQMIEPYVPFAKVTLILAFLSPLLFVQIVKTIWGRTRFRNLSSNYSNFTPWYLPQGITGNRSFPSGHSAMGWMFLPVLIAVKQKIPKNNKITYKITYFFVISWGIIVSLSRIVVGAHYASDVLFSSMFGIIFYIFLYKKFNDRDLEIDNHSQEV